MTKKQLQELARAAANEYQRAYTAAHPEQKKKTNQRYWENKVKKRLAEAKEAKQAAKENNDTSEVKTN